MRLIICAAPALLLFSAAATSAIGQTVEYRLEGTAIWWREGSADGGVTWQRGTMIVPQQTPSVMIRSWCSFTQSGRQYFGGCFLDAYVGGTGLGDAVDSPFVGYLAHGLLQPRRFGDIIKLDDVDDLEPPGLGTEWLTPSQPVPNVGPYTYANPINRLVEYQLLLDGTEGSRRVDAVFRPLPRIAHLPDRPIVIHDMDDWFRPIAPLLTHEPLTIRVVPAPGTALGIAGGVILSTSSSRRRRRSSGP